MSDFNVKINNLNFSDFTDIYIRKSMLNLSGLAYFKTANIYLHAQKAIDVFLQDSFEAFIDKNKLVKGELELLDIKYSAKNNSFRAGGRDATAVLVDCNWENNTNEWKKQTVLNLLNIICSEYNITLFVETSAASLVTKKLESFKINEGETVYEAVKRLCNTVGVLPISYGDNKLTITGTSSDNYMSERLYTGSTRILAAELNYNNTDRFYGYTVKGTGIETANKDLVSYLQVYGSTVDNIISDSNRTKVYLSDNELDFSSAVSQAKYIRNLKAGFSRLVTYTLRDWIQDNGQIWKINSLIYVDDSLLRLKKQMLIYMLEFIYNSIDGWITKMYLVDKNTFTSNDNRIMTDLDSR